MSDVNKTYVFETVLISGTTGTTAEYITGATFNPTTGDLNLETVSGNTITTNFDGRYSLTGHTHDDLYSLTGHTHDDLYSLTGHTHTISEIVDFPTSLSAFTNDEGFITEDTNDFVTGATFNTLTGEFILTTLSGNTVSETLDGRYLLSDDYTPSDSNTDDYVTGGTFNNEILEFTRLSGATFNIDLSNTYSLTGHTHTMSEIVDFSGSTANDYTTTAELTSGNTLNFTRLSGGTYNVVLTGLTGTVAGPITFSAETLSGTTTYVGYGEVNACKIRRIITSSGTTYSAFWSNGEETLDKFWANRYSYGYF